MANWPKTIYVKGLGIAVNSWDEVDELIKRYGVQGPMVIDSGSKSTAERHQKSDHLTASDTGLLKLFVSSPTRGVRTKSIGEVLGTSRRGIKPALDAWARKIKLVDHVTGTAFEPVKRADGRGYRLLAAYVQSGKALLGE